MINKNTDTLAIFDSFVMREQASVVGFIRASDSVSSSTNTGSIFIANQDATIVNTVHGEYVKKSSKIMKMIKSWRKSKSQKKMVLNFFGSMKNDLIEMEEQLVPPVEYDALIEYATSSMQTALAEKADMEKAISTRELLMLKAGIRLCLTEKQVITLSQRFDAVDRGIRLDWVKNFCRALPERVHKEFIAVDSKFKFDNYVIMHYDPNGKHVRETKADEELRKDPILFGVIKNSRKLYYITDWIDDHCDLTMKDIVKMLNTSPRQLKINFDV